MSSVTTFNIQDQYRYHVPRDQIDLSPLVVWDTTENASLVVQASTSAPKTVVFVKEIRIIDSSLVFTKTLAVDPFLNIIYPDYKGLNDITYNVLDKSHLKLLGDFRGESGVVDAWVLIFDPVIRLQGSNAKNTFTIQKDANITSIDSGSMYFLTKGWTMEETDL